MSISNRLNLLIEKTEPDVLEELKEDYQHLDFIIGLVSEDLELPDLIADYSEKQTQMLVHESLNFILHLLKNRCVVVGSMTEMDFVRWESSPEKSVERIACALKKNGAKTSPLDDDAAWFGLSSVEIVLK